ncbi:hypothetical protein OCGS_0655 [Oceaniovalibus guishaninsula JLT2003]|uniref:Uncharacterized protein n=1 Tax=Oceaniovalibus guishaninsula JLT2003 TaxID=1231392 RepID=K2I9B0_9RHOB|nr:hypothetical protein [Oceaniovalibus guishaninsula]EKE45565.1 hypothetical protein OCGS_0655 [Oceaniovalibus guishaninsula JLT2003]
MHDIAELQRRLAHALDRIGTGLDGLRRDEPAQPDTNPELEALRAELEAERATTAQLEERLRAARSRHDEQNAASQSEVERIGKLLAVMEEDRQSLRAANEALRNSNQALREANAEGLSDPHLVNTAILTELDALRTVRSSDRAELDGIIAALAPVLQDGTEGRTDNA